MIVCHCNFITKSEIEETVRALLAEDPSARLEPQFVYRALGKRGRCCGCFPMADAVVDKLLADAIRDVMAAADTPSKWGLAQEGPDEGRATCSRAS